jgi:hypothetical protein
MSVVKISDLTGTFLSRDPVESEPAYQYVGGNVINLTDPSGLQGIERHPGACDGWSYPAINKCLVANDVSKGPGSLGAIEEFYRAVVWRNRLQLGWYVAADLLDHYLDGTEGVSNGREKPGEPYYIYDREWLLQSSQKDREAYNQLISDFVNDHFRPAVVNCSPNPIRAHLTSDEIDPSGDSEVKGALGKHRIQAHFEAWRDGDDVFYADTKVNFFIDDDYDFHPPLGIPVNQYGIGFVPHQWLYDLADAGWAAEFDVYVLWYEHLSIIGSTNSIMYRVDRLFP